MLAQLAVNAEKDCFHCKDWNPSVHGPGAYSLEHGAWETQGLVICTGLPYVNLLLVSLSGCHADTHKPTDTSQTRTNTDTSLPVVLEVKVIRVIN